MPIPDDISTNPYRVMYLLESIADSLSRIADAVAGDGKTSPLLRAMGDIESSINDCMPFPPGEGPNRLD